MTTVQISTTVPTSIKVYDSVANWEKESGSVIGEWMGTFDRFKYQLPEVDMSGVPII